MKEVLTVIALLWAGMVTGQAPCGTPAGGWTPWLRHYQQAKANYITPRADTTLYVPLTIHLTANDEGIGYYPFELLLGTLCRLNEDFAQANMQFYLKLPIRYLPNTAYYNHGSVLDGAEMMFANDVDSTLNIYFVQDPAGNCGYNLPYASIAVAHACSGYGSTTLTHETGHAFRLPHPFLGWEGKKYMSGDTAPVQVTYDYTYFQDTLILDTLIIDTAWVELVDGSNCAIAADGFCDTPPDYLSYRWPCDANGLSKEVQTDPNGATFKSHGEFYMSYSSDNCQSKFSPEQIATMRTFVLNERPEYLVGGQSPLPEISTDKPTLILPEYNALTDPNHTTLVWSNAGNTALYHLMVSPKLTLSQLIVDTIIADTSFVLTGLDAPHNYFWKVQAFNTYRFCAPVSKKGRFKADPAVATLPISPGTGRIFPTIVASGGTLTIEPGRTHTRDLQLICTRMDGSIVKSARLPAGAARWQWPVGNLPAGLYVLAAYDHATVVIRQLVIIQ